MADSKRQKIIDAIKTRMEGILIANGYETNLGQNVEDWKVNWNEEDLPALAICDTVEAVEFANNQPTATKDMCVLPVMLRVFLKSDTPAKIARKYQADLTKAIGVDKFWTVSNVRLALWTRLTRRGIIVPSENLEIAGCAVEIEIAFMTQTFNSYQ